MWGAVVTSILRRAVPGGGTGPSADPAARLPSGVRVRRPVLAMASVGLVAASIAVFVGIASHASRRVDVLTVVQPVAQGQTIVASDLGTDTISTTGTLATVTVADAAGVLGRVAAVPLVPGSLLVAADVAAVPVIQAGSAVVGLALKDGQLPSSGVSAGETVMVVQTAAPGASVSTTPPVVAAGMAGLPSTGSSGGTGTLAPSGGSTGVLVPSALVVATAAPPTSSSGSTMELVSVEVAAPVAADVSVAAAAGQVSLVLVPSGGRGA